MKKKLLFAVIALILTAGVFAQTEADFEESQLLGKWEYLDEGKPIGEFWEFFSDGTSIVFGVKCEWKAENGRLSFFIEGEIKVADYKISGTTLIVYADGEELTLIKR